jgi:methionyl-tRNA formyltransferase
MNIIFFGTADFAVISLDYLVKNGFNIKAIVTAPDKPAGRGLKLKQSPVKNYALNLNIPILQPTNLKDPAFAQQLQQFSADLFAVVAFRFLPKQIWQLPPKGTINLHASYLPDYRGAAPINWVLINGEKFTGVSTFFINEKIDTGDILLRKRIPIAADDTAGTLHDKLAKHGAELLAQTITLIEKNQIKPIPQEHLMDGIETLHKAPKIFKQDCKINWNQPAEKIYNFIRGLSPKPTAWSNLTIPAKNSALEYVKIYSARPVIKKHNLNPGQIIIDNKKILVAASDYFIQILSMQLPGKKILSAQQILNGTNLANAFFN